MKWSAERRQLHEISKDDKAREAAGIKAHRHPTDPWAEVEWRVCEPGCAQHGGGAA